MIGVVLVLKPPNSWKEWQAGNSISMSAQPISNENNSSYVAAFVFYHHLKKAQNGQLEDVCSSVWNEFFIW